MTLPIEELMRYFSIDEVVTADYAPRFNAAPGQLVPAIISHDGKRRLGTLKWGLIPSWAKEEKIGSMMINAKAETLAEKPAFRESFARRRCIIPADGFYEWRNSGTGKQPMRIVMADRIPFALAGLYDSWVSPEGRKIASCTVITTTPNELMAGIHDRMPVILKPEDITLWLDRSVTDTGRLRRLLAPFEPGRMSAYPVSQLVGNVRNDDPSLLQEVPSQPELF